MFTNGKYIINIVLIVACVGDPDLFPQENNDCHDVHCSANPGQLCCKKNQTATVNGDPDNDAFPSTTSAIVFFAAVMGSLLIVILMMVCCFHCQKLLSKQCFKKLGENERNINTVSASVQTSEDDIPPPYVYAHDTGDGLELQIPRCPSYIKDPPKYEEMDETSCHDFTEDQDPQNVNGDVIESNGSQTSYHDVTEEGNSQNVHCDVNEMRDSQISYDDVTEPGVVIRVPYESGTNAAV